MRPASELLGGELAEGAREEEGKNGRDGELDGDAEKDDGDGVAGVPAAV